MVNENANDTLNEQRTQNDQVTPEPEIDLRKWALALNEVFDDASTGQKIAIFAAFAQMKLADATMFSNQIAETQLKIAAQQLQLNANPAQIFDPQLQGVDLNLLHQHKK